MRPRAVALIVSQVSTDCPESSGDDPEQKDAMPPSPGKILVVDDEFISREMLAHLLGSHGYEVTPAADGPAALSSIDHLLPDLVLLDVTIPGMDGLEVLRRLRIRF